MKQDLLEILVCPVSLEPLEVRGGLKNGQFIEGELYCKSCNFTFSVKNGIPVFGVREQDRTVKEQEMDGENEWVFSANDLAEHVDYAELSSERTEATIEQLNAHLNGQNKAQLRVLDVGAGWGAFQSWQFAVHGFKVVAAEISPEFLFASDCVTQDAFFERIVADCTVMPFKNESFDVILCKEFIHHLANPRALFQELWRVSAPNGLVVVQEPCTSLLKNKQTEHDHDVAVHAGITHYYYSYGEYLKHLKAIVQDIEVEGEFTQLNPTRHPIVTKIQNAAIRLGEKNRLAENLILKLFLRVFGGEVSFIGRKRSTYAGRQIALDRNVQPIALERLEYNNKQLHFYTNELVPTVFSVFKGAHKKYNERSR